MASGAKSSFRGDDIDPCVNLSQRRSRSTRTEDVGKQDIVWEEDIFEVQYMESTLVFNSKHYSDGL